MQVNQRKAHQYEVERSVNLPAGKLNARSTPVRKMSKDNIEEMKMRLGNKQYFSVKYQQQHHLKFKNSYHHQKPKGNKEIDELCDRLKNVKTGNIQSIKKDLNGILNKTHKKLERQKEYFKEERWKRAQGGEEINPLDIEEELAFEAIIQNKKYMIKSMVKRRFRAAVIEIIVMLNGFSSLSYANYMQLFKARIRLLEHSFNRVDDSPKPTFTDKVESKIRSMLKNISCPYCCNQYRCAVCLLDDENTVVTTHQLRVIEDVIIAFVQLITHRDIQTFIFEFIRIIKTMFGVSIVNFDYATLLPIILRPILAFCDMKIETLDLYSKMDFPDLCAYISKLFSTDLNATAAQGSVEKELEGVAFHDMNLFDTRASGWMETDLFRFGSNWFSYMCYLCISKGACADIPFLGDLMKATIEDGKKTSKDILKYSIKTLEFILGKGKLALSVGFIPTFYHSKDTILTLKRRYDRLCEDYLKKGNPKVYGLDFTKFASELQSMRKELTDLSRVGTAKLREEISKMLTRVIIMHNDVTSDSIIYADRKSPFSLLIWGKTSIGKTVFVNLTTKVNCDVHGFEFDPRFIYTKNDDERDDGYKSDMHTTILDDIGNKNPGVCPNGDPLINKLISYDNNIASITLQAELENKGKIPFQSAFMYATANTEHINAMYYLTHPAAALRRFNYFIELELKPEFAENGMFCHNKPNVDYSTFNYWDINIGKYYPGADGAQKNGYVKYFTKITDIEEYYTWLAQASTEHFEQQEARMEALSQFKTMKFCKKGHLSSGKCNCEDWDKLPMQEATVAYGQPDVYTHGSYYLNKHTREINTKNINLKAQGPLDYVLSAFLIDPVATTQFVYEELSKTKSRLVTSGIVAAGISAKTLNLVNSFSLEMVRWSSRGQIKCESVYLAGKIASAISAEKHKNNGECDGLNQAWIALSEVLFPQQDKILSTIMKITGVLTTLFVGYKLYNKCTEQKIKNNYKFETLRCDNCVARNVAQGGLISKSSSEFWVDQSNVLRDADVGASSLYYKNKQQEFLNIIAANTVLIKCCLRNKNMVDIRALCLGGWCYVTNYHTIKDRNIEFIELIQDNINQANCNLVIKYDFSDIVVDKKKDLCYFYIKDNKPKKNITNLLYRGNLNDTILDGCYLARNHNGSISQREVRSVHSSVDTVSFTDGSCRNIDTFTGRIATSTKVGDCGMPLIVFSHFGPVLVGLHITGKEESCSATRFGAYDLKNVQLNFKPDLAPAKMVFSDAHKTMVPERLISHPAFLPSTSTLIRYGSIHEGGSRCKSSVIRTPMAEMFEELGYNQLKTAPPMNNWRIYRKNLEELTDKASLVDQNILNSCIEEYMRHITWEVPDSEFDELGVLSDEANINGVPGVDYIDKINRNTSMGFPWCRPKKNYLFPCSTPEYPDGVEFSQEIMDEFHRQDYVSRTACMTHAVYNTSQKDEPLPHSKCLDWGTRLFCGANAPATLRDRKYYLTIVRFFQRNRIATRTAIGTVVQSSQWGDIADILKFKDRIMAGDYKKFDKKQQIRILHGAFDVLETIAKRSRQYDDIDLNAMLAIRCDTVYALVHFDGDLLAFFGALPSGNPMTTLLNCLCNIMLDMYAYCTAGNKVISYFEEVVTIVYGDDSITCVHPNCSNFNHTIKQRELAKIGITFTMAEKDKDSVPFINLSEATFLKRKFVFDEAIGAWMAPLEESNIVSSLMVWVMSKNLSPSEQAYASMQNSIREFFFHGKQKFNQMKDIYTIIYMQIYKQEILFPSYEDILESFRSYSNSSIAQGAEEYVITAFNMSLLFLAALGTCCIRVMNRPERRVMREEHESCRTILNTVRSSLPISATGIEQSIFSYIGRCLVLGCYCFREREILCLLHSHSFKKLTRRLKLLHSVNICYACSEPYPVSDVFLTGSLCPACTCVYICFECHPYNLCGDHDFIHGSNYRVMNTFNANLIVSTTSASNLIFNMDDQVHFVNYHLHISL